MTDRELMQEALEAMLSAINAGDWKVDGACDPHATIIRLRNRLAQPEPVHTNDTSEERVQVSDKHRQKWVGLTDEEVKDIVWNLPYEPSQEHIRAIEAKLREKNT
jgi:hypothetical protein